jgi:hypothetical protein
MVTQCHSRVLHMLVADSPNSFSRWIFPHNSQYYQLPFSYKNAYLEAFWNLNFLCSWNCSPTYRISLGKSTSCYNLFMLFLELIVLLHLLASKWKYHLLYLIWCMTWRTPPLLYRHVKIVYVWCATFPWNMLFKSCMSYLL